MIAKAVAAVFNHPAIQSGHPVEEWPLVAILLSATGGYLDAFTWLGHGVLTTVQSGNILLFSVRLLSGQFDSALITIPPILAFVVGVFVANYLGYLAPEHSKRLSLIIEIVVLLAAIPMHMMPIGPTLLGTVGFCFASAVQNTCFTRVEGWAYSSVMATRNLQVTTEGLLATFMGSNPKASRQAKVFGLIVLAFATGAAVSAYLTRAAGPIALLVPVCLVTVSLVVCEVGRLYQVSAD